MLTTGRFWRKATSGKVPMPSGITRHDAAVSRYCEFGSQELLNLFGRTRRSQLGFEAGDFSFKTTFALLKRASEELEANR